MNEKKIKKIALCMLFLFPCSKGVADLKSHPYSSTKVISDSLVEELSCAALTEQSILKAIKKERYSIHFHIPIHNWGFRSGGAQLAGCWSLAHAQRLMFYLAQFDQPSNLVDVPKVLDLIRGTVPYANENSVAEKILSNYEVISVDAKDLNINSEFWSKINQGVSRSIGNGQYLQQNFKSEIEHWQVQRFFNPANLRLIAGNGARSKKDDEKTLKEIVSSVSQNQLPMVILRPVRNSQHVVLIKSLFQSSNGDFIFTVYDSNQPERDQELTYKKDSGHFFAPAIVNGLPGVNDPNIPLGVFTTGENEFKKINKALMVYYRKLCR